MEAPRGATPDLLAKTTLGLPAITKKRYSVSELQNGGGKLENVEQPKQRPTSVLEMSTRDLPGGDLWEYPERPVIEQPKPDPIIETNVPEDPSDILPEESSSGLEASFSEVFGTEPWAKEISDPGFGKLIERSNEGRKKNDVSKMWLELEKARTEEEKASKNVKEFQELILSIEELINDVAEQLQAVADADSATVSIPKMEGLEKRYVELTQILDREISELQNAEYILDNKSWYRRALENDFADIEQTPSQKHTSPKQPPTQKKKTQSAKTSTGTSRRFPEDEKVAKERAAVAAAEAAHDRAKQRLAAGMALIQQRGAAEVAAAGEARARRVAALLALKASAESAGADVAAANLAHQRKAEVRAKEETSEARELLKLGKNPHEVFRRRQVEKAALKERKTHKEQLENSEKNLEKILDHENKIYIAKRIAEEEGANWRSKWAASMSRSSFEAQRATYLATRTLPNADLTDNTNENDLFISKLVDPSRVVNRWKLGKGKSDAETAKKLQQRFHIQLPHQQAQQDLDQLPPGTFDSSDEENVAASRPVSSVAVRAPEKSETKLKSPRQLSTWEKKKVEETKIKHTESLIRKQVVWGTEFKGPAFLPKPAEIIFSDFEVGKKYSLRLTLTNVSLGINSFKILDLSDAIKDFFVLKYGFPGRMSAGMSCKVEIIFEPRMREDIFDSLTVFAETGPIHIPLKCTVKRTIISFKPENGVLEFGTVIRGESEVKEIEIINSGAIPTDFELLEKEEVGSGSGNWFSFQPRGHVAGYTSSSIFVTFAPQEDGTAVRRLSLRFASKEVEIREIILRGKGGALPVFTEQEVIDFRTCLVDQVYRNVFLLHNLGRTAQKVTLLDPPELLECLEVAPRFGYVQPNANFSFNLKFRPTRELLERVCRNGLLQVRLKVQVHEQTIPLEVSLRALVTVSDLILAPSPLEFGTCALGESLGVPFSITNASALPCNFGILDLPKGVEIKPGGGFGSLLPGETAPLTALFTPYAATRFDFTLTCQSTLSPSRIFRLPCSASAVATPVTLATTLIRLPATPIGCSSTGSVILKNISQSLQTFEFGVPAGTPLRVSPLVETVPPGGSVRVQVEFRPQEIPLEEEGGADVSRDDVAEGRPADVAEGGADVANGPADFATDADVAANPADVAASPADETSSSADVAKREGSYFHQKVILPCTLKGLGGKAGGVLHLQVETTTIPPQLILEGLPRGTDSYTLDFGQVPVGHSSVQNFIFRNIGKLPVKPRAFALDHLGVFTLLTALRWITPGGQGEGNRFPGERHVQKVQKVAVQFAPLKKVKYREELKVVGEGGLGLTSLNLVLTGEGISPSVSVSAKEFDFGEILNGDAAEQSFSILNSSNFGVNYRLKMGRSSPVNVNGLLPFFCVPSEGQIAAGASAKVTVTFGPDRGGVTYDDVVNVEVSNQEDEICVHLHGRCWSQGLYLTAGDPPSPQSEYPSETPLGQPPKISVSLTSTGKSGSKTLIVGACESKSGSKTGGEFSIEALSSGWSVEPARGSLAPGEKKVLTVMFNPPRKGPIVVKEWVDATAVCVLKGGNPPPKVGQVHLALRCLLGE